MNRSYSFYAESTGLFINRRASLPERAAMPRPPKGCVTIEGEYDHLSQRMDLAAGKVVDYQPPAPSSDHEWNSESKRWVKNPAVVEKELAAAAAQKEIEALERSQLRSMRELLIDSENREAKARLVEIEVAISEQRAVIQNATDTQTALDTDSLSESSHP